MTPVIKPYDRCQCHVITKRATRLGAGTRYAKLRGAPLSPTSRQHAYKSAVLALGLTSCPPNPQAGAHHGAIIAIPTAVRRAMHFGGRARAFCMRGRRTSFALGVLGTSWCAPRAGVDLAYRQSCKISYIKFNGITRARNPGRDRFSRTNGLSSASPRAATRETLAANERLPRANT